jgi:hypothetical protein
LLAVATLPVCATAADESWQDRFSIDQYTMSPDGENAYWSLRPGHYVVLGGLESDGSELVVISVLDETEIVDGIETRVIEEREFENGELVEVSRNFFARAKETDDIYYFGEDVDYFEDGEIVAHDGEWRAGVNDARPGLYMPAKPTVGMKFYMEIAPDEAMDRAEIFETGATCETPKRTFSDCLIVTESSPLEPGDESYKRYAKGVGMIHDDGLDLYKHGKRFKSENYVEFEITEDQMADRAREVLYDLHPTGVVKEVKVEIRKKRAFYAVETFIDGDQWDVEVRDDGEVFRNKPD